MILPAVEAGTGWPRLPASEGSRVALQGQARRVSTRMLRAGIGNGARVAAVVSQLCRGVKAGVALISYPVNEAMPTHIGMKRSADESSEGGDNSVRPASPMLHASDICRPHRDGD